MGGLWLQRGRALLASQTSSQASWETAVEDQCLIKQGGSVFAKTTES